MKTFLFFVLAMVFAASVSAASLETRGSYVSVQNTPSQGMAYGLTYGFSVFNNTGFVKDITLGASGTLTMLNSNMYDVFLAPMLKVSIPLAYAEFGFGYDIMRLSGVNSNDYAWVIGLGLEGKLTDTTKIAFGFDVKRSIKADVWTWLVGPAFTFAL